MELRSLWVFAQVAGFHLNDCIEYFTAPCWLFALLDGYRSFSQKEGRIMIFSVNPVRDYTGWSKNLLVERCEKVKH